MTDHNHVTRDIKPPGECPACDALHAEQARRAEIKAHVADAKEEHAKTLRNLEDR